MIQGTIRSVEPLSLRCLLAQLSLWLFFAATSVSLQAQVTSLNSGEKLTRSIAPAETHVYRIPLKAGQFCQVLANERPGIDLILKLSGPRNRRLAGAGGYRGYLKSSGYFTIEAALEEVSLSFISDTDGFYQLEVDARETQVTGNYEIKIAELHQATAADELRVEASRAFERGERLRFPALRHEDLKTALTQYESALKTYRSMRNRLGEARSLDAIAMTQLILQNMDQAVAASEEAVRILKAEGNVRSEIVALRHLLGIHLAQLHFEQALSLAQESVRLSQSIGDQLNEARSLYAELAVRLKMPNEFANQARLLALYSSCISIFHEVGSAGEEAFLICESGVYASNFGEAQHALDLLRQGLELMKSIGYKRYYPYPLLHIGEIYYDHGDFQKAFDSYSEALSLSRNTEGHYEAYALYNVGMSALALGDKRALDYFARALTIWEGDRNGEAYTMTGIGRFYFKENKIEKALANYLDALPVMEQTGDKYGVGIILTDIGIAYAAQGNREKAISYYDKALEAHRRVQNRRDEARTLICQGQLYESAKDFASALKQYQQALEIYQTIGNRDGESNAYFAIAKAERATGDLSAAQRNINETLSIVESLRAGILGQDLRASYFASVHSYYEFYTDLLMSFHQQTPDKGFDRLALQASESSRARTLLELLVESRADIRQGIDTALLKRERELRRQLDDAALQQVQFRNQPHSVAEQTAIESKLSDLTEDFKAIEAQIRAASPHYAEITQPGSISINEMQAALDENTVILEYALGETRSFLWLVTRDDLKSFVLPGRAEIEPLARQFYLATAHSNSSAQSTQQGRNGTSEVDPVLSRRAGDLSQILLGPVLPLISGKRLLIVSDGALQFVPFAALPESVASRSAATTYAPLVADHEIINLPSVETLVVLRRELSTRSPASKTLAVFADPVFSAVDARVAMSPTAPSRKDDRPDQAVAASSGLQRALRDSGYFRPGEGIPRLPFSRSEANAISKFVPPDQILKLLDFQATRETVQSRELASYRIVHIATHGLLNSQHPELSGLLFSLVDEQGRAKNGFLQLHEIYNLELPVDLVVLSACQTALGVDIRGEGLIGLTRGFMYAGAKRVLATLWQVDDAATAEMMRLFYEALLKEEESPSAALRTAQKLMQKHKRYADPYYWAGFTLQGDWR